MKRRLTKKHILPLCYGVFLLCAVLRAVFFLCFDALQEELVLSPADGVAVNLSQNPDGSYTTENEDGQLLFEDVMRPVRRVALVAEFAEAPGEMDLYYARAGLWRYLPGSRVFAQPTEAGYSYALFPCGYTSLRVDLGTLPQNTVAIHAVVLNPRQSPAAYFTPTLRGLLAFLVWPALASCGIYTIIEVIPLARKTR